jgi:peptidoglycan hydrolase-like protein with peptidoglycan-binding domain
VSPGLADRIRFAKEIAEAAGVTASTTQSAEPDSVTLQVQQDLSELGYAPGSVDGSMDQQTRRHPRQRPRPAETGDVSDALS